MICSAEGMKLASDGARRVRMRARYFASMLKRMVRGGFRNDGLVGLGVVLFFRQLGLSG